MKAKDFIEKKLRQLALTYIGIQIRYEYRVNSKSHIIEIIPLSFFEGNENYFIEEGLIEDEFEKMFPEENIVFISEGSLTEIKDADLKLGYNELIINWHPITSNYEVSGHTEDVENKKCKSFALAS